MSKIWARARIFRLVMSLSLFLTLRCYATSHVFVLNDDGVWLVSDTLWVHSDGFTQTELHKCKAVFSKGRIIFNAGAFSDLNALLEKEAALPMEDVLQTQNKAIKLMSMYPQTSPLPPDPNRSALHVGIIQVQNGVFTARWAGLAEDLDHGYQKFVVTFRLGVPHGYGDAVDRVNSEAKSDPSVEVRIAKDPKAELLKILQEEADSNPGTVGPPFTVLLLHKDGTISDMSDTHVCEVPKEAQFVSENKTPASSVPPNTPVDPKQKRKHWWSASKGG